MEMSPRKKKVTFCIFGRKDRRVLFHVGVGQGDEKRDDMAVEAPKFGKFWVGKGASANIAVARKVKKGNP